MTASSIARVDACDGEDTDAEVIGREASSIALVDACEVEDADIIEKEGIGEDEGDYYSVGADEDDDDALGAIGG